MEQENIVIHDEEEFGIKEDTKRKKIAQIKGILLTVGLGLLAFAAIFYILMADVKLNVSAQWLFGSLLTVIAGILLYFIGEVIKDSKKILSLVLKGLGILFALSFIVFLILFKGSSVFPTTQDKITIANSLITTCIIFTSLGAATLIGHYVVTFLTLEDE